MIYAGYILPWADWFPWKSPEAAFSLVRTVEPRISETGSMILCDSTGSIPPFNVVHLLASSHGWPEQWAWLEINVRGPALSHTISVAGGVRK